MDEGGHTHICIRVPNWVGDVVMATPALRAAREQFPDARLTVIVHRRVEAVLRGAPWFDEAVAYDPEGEAGLSFLGCVRRLRRERPGLALIFPNSFSSALMMRLGGVRRRVGYARDLRSLLLTDALARPSRDGRFEPTYMVDYYLALCRAAGIAAGRRDPELPYAAEEARRAEQILRDRGVGPEEELLLLHPGAGYGASKRWPTERFARLAELLQREIGARAALIAGPAERQTVEGIKEECDVSIADLTDCGIDLHLLKPVVARSRLMVTTDSGPRHYGVALGVPTVCVMGPTHPGYSTSERPNDHVVRLDVECGPCQRKRCPRDHRCMEEISAEMVLEACCAALAGAPEGRGR